MRYFFFVMAFSWFHSYQLSAQESSNASVPIWQGYGLIGYGNYSMNSLKDFQESLEQATPTVPLQTVESFPAYVLYEMGVNRFTNKFTLGFYFAFQSTAGRVSYTDYSGELTYDQLVRGKTFGSSITWNFNTPEKIKMYAGIRGGFTLTDVDLDNSIKIGNQVVQEDYLFKSLNVFVGPVLGVRKSWGHWSAIAELRLDLYIFNGPLTLNGKGDGTLEDSGKNVKADWTGLRGLLGIGYNF